MMNSHFPQSNSNQESRRKVARMVKVEYSNVRALTHDDNTNLIMLSILFFLRKNL
jgi:hypothetical protein